MTSSGFMNMRWKLSNNIVNGAPKRESEPKNKNWSEKNWGSSFSFRREERLSKRQDLWAENSWIIPSYSFALSWLTFWLNTKRVSAPYSMNLAPWDFLVFPKQKNALQRTQHESSESNEYRSPKVDQAMACLYWQKNSLFENDNKNFYSNT